MIATRPGVAARVHRVTLQNPGPPVPDGDGGYTQGWIDLDPPGLFVEIDTANRNDMERLTSGTVIAVATHIVSGPFHPGVTTATRLLFGARVFEVAEVRNVEERGVTMIMFCVELKEP